MTSEAYLWIWLPDGERPVVCGRIRADEPHYEFVYGRSYLALAGAIPLDPRELPLRGKSFRPDVGELHGVLRDAAPDAWGRRVMLYRAGGAPLSELDFLRLAGYDRIGALDVCDSAERYEVSAFAPVTLDDLFRAARMIEEGEALPAELDNALLHGSSIGGARPKALLEDGGKKWIAKFSSSADHHPLVRFEHAAMWLAGRCGIQIPEIQLARAMGRDVLLIRRFDRVLAKGNSWHRRFMISALTALGLHETEAQMSSYVDLAGFIRRFGDDFVRDARELYMRMVFNILVGNTDDHARNHSFLWDGRTYVLSPAYDICPMLRSGHTASQGMEVGRFGRLSTLGNALSEAEQFGLAQLQAKEMQDDLVERIEALWPEAASISKLTKNEAALLRRATVLSPGCFYE